MTRRPVVLPGITVTRSRPGSELGYLTAAGAARFGAALQRHSRAGHALGASDVAGLFARGVQVALASAHPAAAPRPGRGLRTLTVRATTLAGRPVTGGIVIVSNADNLNAFTHGNQQTFRRGIARFLVPAGHYFALAWFTTARWVRQVVLPQFTVRRATTVRMPERAASSKVSFTTPRPAAPRLTGLWLKRTSTRGGDEWFASLSPGRQPQWANPTPARPTAGTLRAYTTGQLFSPRAAAGHPYVYNLDFAGPAGIMPAQHWTARPASLAAVTNRYYSAVRMPGTWSTFGVFAAQDLGFALFGEPWSFTLPQTQIQYFSAGPALIWAEEYGDSDYGLCCGDIGAYTTLRPGQQLTHDWNAYPLHPQPNRRLLHGPLAARFPELQSSVSDFRTGNLLNVDSGPFSDNYPGDIATGPQLAPGNRITEPYAIYQNGRRIARGNLAGATTAPAVRVSGRPSAIRFVLTARETSPLLPLSPASQTTWTWHTRRDPGATIPSAWTCYAGLTVATRHCAVQPEITLDYHIAGLSLRGTTRPGPQAIGLDISHIQLGGHAPITRTSARISLNSGQTWQRPRVTALGPGRFRITFTAPARATVTLRVHASDSAGGSITETILRAWAIASPR